MTYTIEELPGEPIILVTVQEAAVSQLERMINELNTLLDAQPEPIYLIANMLDLSLELSDLIVGANSASRGAQAPFRHPNVKHNVFVTNSSLIRLGAKGLKSDIFGNISIELFDTLEDALAYVRAQ